MILNVISDFIYVDQIAQAESNKCVHFITYFDETLYIPKKWESRIYTSNTISKYLQNWKLKVPAKYITTVKSGQPFYVLVCDNVKIRVTMFENNNLEGSISFYFKYEDCTAFYAGVYPLDRSVIYNDVFRTYVEDGIKYLYVDNTKAECVNHVTINDACLEIADIAKEYPTHTLFIHVSIFGYETFIYNLAEKHMRVYVTGWARKIFTHYKLPDIFERDPKKATAIIGCDTLDTDTLYNKFSKCNRLTIRIVGSNFKTKNCDLEKLGLFQVHWCPHPSMFDLNTIITMIKPQFVKEIWDDLPKLRKFYELDRSPIRVWKAKTETQMRKGKNMNDQIDQKQSPIFLRETEEPLTLFSVTTSFINHT